MKTGSEPFTEYPISVPRTPVERAFAIQLMKMVPIIVRSGIKPKEPPDVGISESWESRTEFRLYPKPKVEKFH